MIACRKHLFVVLHLLTLLSQYTSAQKADFDHTDFKKADSVAQQYKGSNLSNLPQLAFDLTSPLETEIEQFRAIFKWVTENLENDYSLFALNKRKRAKFQDQPEILKTWNERFQKMTFRSLLESKKTVCTGYAYIVRELARLAGFECEIVHGYGQTASSNLGGKGTANHSWNAIKINKKWYLCDATWSSGSIIIKDISEYIPDYHESYFLTDPSTFILNHYPLDTKWTLLDSVPSLDEFLNSPLVYKNAFKHATYPKFPETFHYLIDKGDSVSFLIDSSQEADKIKVLINNQTKKPNSIKQHRCGTTEINYSFRRKGTHTVHFFINDDILFTYNIRCK